MKQVVQGGTTTTFGYNGVGDRLSQTVGVTTTHYVLDPGAGLTQVLSDGTNTYLYGNDRLAQYQASMQYFGADGLGSVRQIYDASAAVVGSSRYDPFGNVMAQSGATSVFAFAGEQYDAGTGLEYLRARYYSSAQGRFTTRDVWEGDPNAPMSYNAWLYVYANAVNLTDPSGHDPIWCAFDPTLPFCSTPTPTKTPAALPAGTPTLTSTPTLTCTPTGTPTSTATPTVQATVAFGGDDIEETAKAAGAELDHLGKNRPPLRTVTNSKGDQVQIVSDMWGDHSNRDWAFRAIAYTVRNRVALQNAGKATFDNCSIPRGAPAKAANCARSQNYNAYYANRGYQADQHEKDLAMSVLYGYADNQFQWAVLFNSTGNTPAGYTLSGFETNYKHIDSAVLDAITLHSTATPVPPSIASFFFYTLN